MKFKDILLSLSICSLLSSSALAQRKLEPFKKGDRVVFAGNSITEAGLYESFIWLYYMLHYPDRRIEIINGGVGGDVAGQIYDRLNGDLLKKKPNILAVTFGMNDSRYFEYVDKNKPMTEEKRAAIVKESFDSYAKIEGRLKRQTQIQPILMASSPYDETVKQEGSLFTGKAITMEKIIDFQLASAKTNNWGYVDFFHPMTEINQREQKKNPAYTNTGTDRIHPGGAGHFIMAYIFLKAQGLANQKVADVQIDASQRKVLKTTNASITALKASRERLSYDYLAKSLPFPVDSQARIWMNFQVQAEALPVIPFNKEFNEEMLTVKGLATKTYQLKIDGKSIGKYTAADFEQGINLALLRNTPQYEQAKQIMDLNYKRRDVESKFRNYYWVEYDFLKDKGLLFNRTQVALDTINSNAPKNGWLNAKKGDYESVAKDEAGVQAAMDAFTNQIYKVNKPVKRHVEIIAL
ncbi:MAG: SGNH/GDSL hydrolase family protein [Bacteroidota bacterium]